MKKIRSKVNSKEKIKFEIFNYAVKYKFVPVM